MFQQIFVRLIYLFIINDCSFNPIGLRMTDEVLLSQNEGSGGRLHHKASNFGHSEKVAQPGLELRFEHLDFSVKGKQILEDVSGTATPGKILAVMGPSGKFLCL